MTLTPNPSPIGTGEGSRECASTPNRRPRAPRANSNISEAARRFRKEPTHSEAILWNALRNRQLSGAKFRRQHPAGPFVLDFYCDKHRLAVEVDGPVHNRQASADRERHDYLEARGIGVVRVPSELVERDLHAALTTIAGAIASPLPPPRERGQG
jgi:very-short-patch-repair endonuclease